MDGPRASAAARSVALRSSRTLPGQRQPSSTAAASADKPFGAFGLARPAARQLAWLLVQPFATLPAADAAAVGRVEQDRDALIVAKLARRFTALVRACNAASQTDAVAASAELDAWLVEAGGCGVPTMETFAGGLRKDGDAIRAALTTPWSNGQTERAGQPTETFDLLRRCVLLAA